MSSSMDLADAGQQSLAPPPRLREFLAIALWVALADVTIYRGAGYAGLGLLLALSPMLLALGVPQRRLHGSLWIVGGMLLLLAARAAWLGSPLTVAVGLAALIAFCVTVQGRAPHVWDVPVFALQSLPAGYVGLHEYRRWIGRGAPHIPGVVWLNILLPLAALVVFGTIFVMANPDLAQTVARRLEALLRWPNRWSEILAESLPEVAFWIVVGWLFVGLLRPVVRRSLVDMLSSDSPPAKPLPAVQMQLYKATRNTLLAVNGLFVVYLMFEFRTLWFREFPPGFYYAGYAHQGAGWLTAALALATLLLSVIFRRLLPVDPRTITLRRLEWVWSALNLVLALAVYNRMHIYIDFNGLTRMRMIGLFGISTVVAGFLLVVGKIANQRDFVWLVSRQLWALVIAVYLFALTPVDMLVHAYNVRQILRGDLAPAVQITEHPINAEGMLMLEPLLHCDDELIREGIRALHAEWGLREELLHQRRAELGWTSYQASDVRLLQQLRGCRDDWETYRDDGRRTAAWTAFREYAYRWY